MHPRKTYKIHTEVSQIQLLPDPGSVLPAATSMVPWSGDRVKGILKVCSLRFKNAYGNAHQPLESR